MAEDKKAYRQIMKATSIFGGVQVFQIIIQIVRSKFVAVLLGPSGMGIVGLLTSTLGVITSATSFGLGTSAVKDVSKSNAEQDENGISEIVTIVRKLVWITGLLGGLTTFLLSSWLSELTFGNGDYALAFAWLAITLVLNQLSIGQKVVLQGLRKIKLLAKASLWGSVIGLFVTIPVYYYYRIDGIVPVLIITSLSTLALTWYYSNKVNVTTGNPTIKQTFKRGKGMLTMGVVISLSGMFVTISSYILRVYIGRTGGVEQVGLYTAGFAIINTYVGLVFTAMGTDYYPRLSEIADDREKARTAINQQAEISILILGPILIAFIVFIKIIIMLLYSSKFIAISEMIHWAALGTFFKASSWAISFIFLAKAEGRLFFWNELIANIYILILNVVGYKFYGLSGLGISFLLGYFLYLIQVYFIAKSRYKFHFDIDYIKIIVTLFSLAVMSFVCVHYLSTVLAYSLGSLLMGVAIYFSFIKLDEKLEIIKIIRNFKNNT
jgi:O-antigen/teichoic acid export membrane protein